MVSMSHRIPIRQIPGVPPRFVPLVALGLGFFVVLADTTAVNVALPAIGNAFGLSVGTLQWVLTAYNVAFASLILTGGALGDAFGSRRLFLYGTGAFAFGAIGCMFAPTFEALVAARILQGAGAALLLPNSLAVLAHAYPEPLERAHAIAAWTGVGAIALTAGPVLGGLLVEFVGWESVFGLNAVFGVLAYGLTVSALTETPRKEQLKLDISGQLIAAGTLATFTFAIAQTGPWGWLDPRVILCSVLAVGGAFLFIRIENRLPNPTVPMGLFRSTDFSIPVIVGFLFNFAFYGTPFVLSLFLQNDLSVRPASVGFLFLPMSIADAVVSFKAGRLTKRFGPRWPITVGTGTAAIGVLLISILGDQAGVLFGYLLVGVGGGAVIAPLTACVLASVSPAQAGVASGILNAARQVGGATGIAALGLIVGGSVSSIATPAALATIAAVFGCAALLSHLFIRPSALDPPTK